MVAHEEEFLAREKKTLRQLEDLKKHTVKGKISETLSANLKKELCEEIEEIDRELVESLNRELEEIQDQLKVICAKTSMLESEQNSVLQQKEELEARFCIKLIGIKEYNEKKKNYTQRKNLIIKLINLNNARIEKLETRAKSITQTLAENRARHTKILP
jgi:hypothetical protein